MYVTYIRVYDDSLKKLVREEVRDWDAAVKLAEDITVDTMMNYQGYTVRDFRLHRIEESHSDGESLSYYQKKKARETIKLGIGVFAKLIGSIFDGSLWKNLSE